MRFEVSVFLRDDYVRGNRKPLETYPIDADDKKEAISKAMDKVLNIGIDPSSLYFIPKFV